MSDLKACCTGGVPDHFPRDAFDTKWFLSTRLETRTKESNKYASSRVANLTRCEVKAKTGWILFSVNEGRCTIGRPAFGRWFEQERICWDPKDGELCLNRMKPEETLVEVRSGTDVQIVRQIWV